ncbi:hypothetical protein LWI29_032731 [Acer saccharum]|uniref:RNase H type-1 domain-containing protein n=1 Tax=Acer saccharum TaxID=4024 RepID=A0AA39VEI3_ACESA|nr:hypothetical protein LWI29_032731 [Acer saccharum]
MMEDRGFQRPPVLESNKIGKEIAIDPMEGNRAGFTDKTDVSGIQGNQGYDEGGNLGPNYMRENGDSIGISNLNYIPVDNEVGRIKAWASDYLVDWKKAHLGIVAGSTDKVVFVASWRPPEVGHWKINTDAATNYKDKLIGLGVIIRDAYGKVKATEAVKMSATLSVVVAEAIAVKCGIMRAVEMGLTRFI